MRPAIAIRILLGLLLTVIVFHLCIVFKLIPYDITWGGRLKNDSEMYVFEAVSILINLFLGWILLMEGKLARPIISSKAIRIILWGFLALFVLNTVGNIIAETNFEKFFALLTLLFSVLIWIVLKGRVKERKS